MTQCDDDLPLYIQWIGPNIDSRLRENGWHGFVQGPDGNLHAAGSSHQNYEAAKAACRAVAQADMASKAEAGYAH